MRFLQGAAIGALVIITGICLYACQTSANNSNSNTFSGQVAATVNGVEIPESSVESYIEGIRSSSDEYQDNNAWNTWLTESGYTEDTLRNSIIDVFVQKELIRQAAEDVGIAIEPSVLDSKIAAVRAAYSTEDAWKKALASAGYSEDDYRRQVESSLLYTELVNSQVAHPVPTNADIQAYFDKYMGVYVGKRSSHILFSIDNRDEANAVLGLLRESDDLASDFASAVVGYSIDSTTRKNGGDRGWSSLVSLEKSYSNALEDLAPGEISGLVQSDYGYHIIYCTAEFAVPESGELDLAHVPPEIAAAMKGSLETELYNAAVSKYLDSLHKKAHIVIFNRDGVPRNSEDVAEEPKNGTEADPDDTGEATAESGTDAVSSKDAASEKATTTG